MAAATMTNSWAHAVPLDETNGYPPPPRAESMRSSDSRPTSQHRRLSARRRSDFHLPSDAEPAAAVRASSRASNMRKRSRNALREDLDGSTSNSNSNSSKQHPLSRAEESAWIHRDKLAEIEIREMEEAGIHVRQSRRSESRGPADRRQERGSSRSMSRSELYRRGSRDRGDGEDEGEEGEEPTLSPHYASFDDFSRRKRVSTIPAVEDEEEAEEAAYEQRPFDHNLDSDFRTPEEIEAERTAHRQRITRPSTSRLPVSKVSPVPVPQTVIGRDSPLPRSRNGSGAWSGHWDDQHYARRARSGSVGSQVMLEDSAAADTTAASYPTYYSSSRPTSSHLHETSHPPRKARVPSKPGPTSGGPRKVSNTTTTTTTAASGGAGTSRPGSSSKPRQLSTNRQRPASSHKKTSPGRHRPSTTTTSQNPPRPEGEAPWIAGMYKPDPRLPQDQQMLPTHAKRLMLEQQAKAGGGGSEEAGGKVGGGGGRGDGDSGPPTGAMWINEKGKWTDSEPSLSSSRQNPPKGGEWPLSPGGSQTSPQKQHNGGGAGAGGGGGGAGGGYRITPTISPPAQIISRKGLGNENPPAAAGGGESHSQPSHQQQEGDEEGAEAREKGSDNNPNAKPLNATPRIPPPPPAPSHSAGFAGSGNTATVTAGGGGGGRRGAGGTGEKQAEEEGSVKKKGKGGCLGCCVVM
ncbi:hypothetical protein KC338_g6082 [Hortaea werneckii]|uniref:Uncharacterized protein n=1 Tax=Hortaea werneckii TaxID=91943 RepID=A0A3M7DQV6_HORWE|nr:hypothetical protein KC323_g6291 [Hortaea werneckii]KAI6862867.1 hypothetical protein KC338_g6082 [Hortaea werneckii]KAI7343350.1 hypothetical protein KC320_g9288 [Hortaea werneckii]RMY66685.1 hypothetical protein D0862_15167 [Hortaea werneckii]